MSGVCLFVGQVEVEVKHRSTLSSANDAVAYAI
jgi:hypothetical protein